MPAPLKKNGSLPIAKIIVGNAQPATYKNKLILANANRLDIGSGSEVDFSNVPGINTVQDLNQSTYKWDVRVIKATTNPSEVHNINVTITQDDTVVFNYDDPDNGEFGDNNAYIWTDEIDFIVQ